ncbi:solute carrier family 35 member, partial [Penicillium chermesinum]
MSDLRDLPGHQNGSGDNIESTQRKNGIVEVVQNPGDAESQAQAPADEVDNEKKGFFAFFKTKEQFLAIANTSTGTLTTLLTNHNWSIPTFQTILNYALLNLIFTPYTIYCYGFKGWLKMMLRDGWKYIILAFCDVEGNYFIVLAYEYTTMLSAQLINFWAIVVVVVISFLFLKVRYHITQIIGIIICIGAKGDLFALLGASFYGLTNTAEEYFVSTRPVYEVLGQLSFWGMIIDGVQSAIFERSKYHTSTWDGQVGGYLVGFTLCLSLFYCLAPLLFRLSSAAFFNISLLTMNFWGVAYWGDSLIYYLGRRALAEARKPWLGVNQERGVAGIATARRRIEHVVPHATEERAANST